MLNQDIDILIVKGMVDEAEVFRRFLLHLVFEEDLQECEVFDDGVDLIAVEGECLFEFVEDADEIEDKAVRFHHPLRLVFVGTVHPGDGLEQGMVAHRLIEIHGVEQRRVKAG